LAKAWKNLKSAAFSDSLYPAKNLEWQVTDWQDASQGTVGTFPQQALKRSDNRTENMIQGQ
jgi:hypothetical protein